MRPVAVLFVSLAPLLLGGCLAKAAFDVATLPVRAVSSVVDLVTTSQSEADEKRGRELRRQEERLGALEREYVRQAERCMDGREEGCRRAVIARAEMDEIMPRVPVERPR